MPRPVTSYTNNHYDVAVVPKETTPPKGILSNQLSPRASRGSTSSSRSTSRVTFREPRESRTALEKQVQKLKDEIFLLNKRRWAQIQTLKQKNDTSGLEWSLSNIHRYREHIQIQNKKISILLKKYTPFFPPKNIETNQRNESKTSKSCSPEEKESEKEDKNKDLLEKISHLTKQISQQNEEVEILKRPNASNILKTKSINLECTFNSNQKKILELEQYDNATWLREQLLKLHRKVALREKQVQILKKQHQEKISELEEILQKSQQENPEHKNSSNEPKTSS